MRDFQVWVLSQLYSNEQAEFNTVQSCGQTLWCFSLKELQDPTLRMSDTCTSCKTLSDRLMNRKCFCLFHL